MSDNISRTITPNPPADFTPSLGAYQSLQPFRYWCQKVLPLVYDDSLSYYELLCKVVDYLNKTMEDVETLHGDVTNLHKAYEELQSYVNNYFSSLDVQEEINNKLDNLAENGTLGNILKNIIKINQPILVKSKEEMADNSVLYILESDGFVYYYNGSEFVPSTMRYNAPINAYESHAHTAQFDINDIKNIGSYTVNPTSLTGMVSENVSGYYWSCYCVTPVVANDVDVLQYLIGLPVEPQNPPVFYYRYSIGGTFSTFTKTLQNKTLKNVCFCGDSFTAVTSVKSYVNFLNEYGCCNGVNLGLSGSYPKTWLEVHENDITDKYDVYFIAFGLNAINIPDGNYNDSTDETYCGQMNILIDKIYSVCPTARIIIWCMDCWFPESRSNSFKKVSEYKGCEFYSMKADKKIPIRLDGKFDGVLENLSSEVVTLKNNSLKLSDNHPNEKAQILLATYLMNII